MTQGSVAMAMASALFDALPDTCTMVAAGQVLDCLMQLTSDGENMTGLQRWLLEAVEGEHHGICLHTAMRAIAGLLQPASYLEIGVRRGWSLAQVCAESPNCNIVGVDTWVSNYAGAPNPGEFFVRAEILRVVPSFVGPLTFCSALRYVPPMAFSLALVDGDHTAAGAWYDLSYALSRAPIGGVVVFDDLLPFSDDGGPETLLDVWARAHRVYGSEFLWRAFPQALVPFGVVVRVRSTTSDEVEAWTDDDVA